MAVRYLTPLPDPLLRQTFAFAKMHRLQVALRQHSTGMTVFIELDVVNSGQDVLLFSLSHTLNAPVSYTHLTLPTIYSV